MAADLDDPVGGLQPTNVQVVVGSELLGVVLRLYLTGGRENGKDLILGTRI